MKKTKNIYLQTFIKLNVFPTLNDLQIKELRIILNPDIIELNLKLDRGKVCVIEILCLWKYISKEEIWNIVRKPHRENDIYTVSKELE